MQTWDIRYDDGRSMCYLMHGDKFVARFKYGRPKTEAKHFAKFLVANFTVEEYFAERAAGKSPLPILEAKGYVAP